MGKKKNKKTMLIATLLAICMLPALALLKTSVFGKEKNAIITDNTARYDIVADLDGGKFELGTKPEFTKMDNGKWLYKYKPTMLPTKIPKPVKTGYGFVGWILEGETIPRPEYSIPAWHKGNLNVRANWKVLEANLTTGLDFNTKVKAIPEFINVTNVVFDINSNTDKGIDVSRDGDGLVKAYVEGNTLYIVSLADKIFINPDATDMFRDMTNLTTIDFSNLNTSKLTNLDSFLRGCSNLNAAIGLENFDTENVTNFRYLFEDNKFIELNLSNWKTNSSKNMEYMFANCINLTTINDISNWDTSKVTTTNRMFYNCTKINNLNVTNWNTAKITDMSRMFYKCEALVEINVSNWNTSSVVDMNGVFESCSALKVIDVSNWNTSSVVDMKNTFANCNSLTTLDVSNFDTSNVTDLDRTFWRCYACTTINVSNWNTSNVTSMNRTFAECYAVKELDVSKWKTSNVTDLTRTFWDCRVIQRLDCSKWDTSKVTNMDRTFCDVNTATEINVTGWNTSACTDFHRMFADCHALPRLDISSFDTSKGTDLAYMFSGCEMLESLDCVGIDTSKSTRLTGLFLDCLVLKKLDNLNIDFSSTTGTQYMFGDCHNLTGEVTVNALVPEQMPEGTDPSDSEYWGIDYMFHRCSNLSGRFIVKYTSPETKELARRMVTTKTSGSEVYLWEDSSILLDGPTFNTKIKNLSGYSRIEFVKAVPKMGVDVSAAQDKSISAYVEDNILKIACIGDSYTGSDVSNMFKGLTAVTNIEFTNFNSSNATNMSYMFSACNSLVEIDLSKLNTSSVTTMHDMFAGCKSIKSFDLSEFDTRNVTSLHGTFYDCDSLTNLDLNSLNTSKVTDIGFIVAECNNLKSVYMNILDVSKVTSIRHLLKYCRNLEHAALPRFDFSKIKDTAQAFAECDKLSSSITINGGATTAYEEMFYTCSTVSPAKFVVRYTDGYREKAQAMVDTKTRESNVVLVGPPSFMVAGNTFNSRVKGISGFANVTSVRFEKGIVPSGTDLSAKSDGSIKGYISGNSLIVKSREDIFANINSSGMFKDFPVNSIIFGNFNTDYVEQMQSMFENCLQLTSVDVSGFNTSNVTNMKYMFKDCRMLANLDLSSFNTSNVEYMNTMFDDCNKLVNLNLDSFTTHSVIDMGNMFNRCSLLKSSITIKNPNITEYRTIFRGCSTASNAKFVVNYISPRTKEVAINMVATKSQNSNVVLGEEIALRCNKIRKVSNLINTESVNPNKVTTPKPSTQSKTVNITLINGPSAVYQKQVVQTKAGKIGDLAKPDLNPKYAGQFGGYFYDKNCTIPVKPNDVVTQDIELYAKW